MKTNKVTFLPSYNTRLNKLTGDSLFISNEETLAAEKLILEAEKEHCYTLAKSLDSKVKELIKEKAHKYLTSRFTAWRFLHLLSDSTLIITCTVITLISTLLSILLATVKTGCIVGAVGIIISFVVNLANKLTDKVIDKHISKIKDWLNLKSFILLKKKIEYSDSEYSQEIIEYIQKNTTFLNKS